MSLYAYYGADSSERVTPDASRSHVSRIVDALFALLDHLTGRWRRHVSIGALRSCATELLTPALTEFLHFCRDETRVSVCLRFD